MTFEIFPAPLDPAKLAQGFTVPGAGAFNCFEGRVRNSNEGRTVVALEYEAYAPLCEKEAQKIFQEAKNAFDIIDMKMAHRTGKLKVGETAVWIGVLAAHRNDSFLACRYAIDELKKRLPIWKKEYYSNGESGWVCCNHTHAQDPFPDPNRPL